MGEARNVIDRMTECMVTKDLDGLAAAYAEDAVITTPDEGEIKGRDQIVGYLRKFTEAFPDLSWEALSKHEDGDTSIDEGYVVGTNTGPLPLPNGGSMPATGKRIRVRSVDMATVENGTIRTHRFYFDQMELLGQLELLPELPA